MSGPQPPAGSQSTIEAVTETAFEVTCAGGAGQIEYWGHGLTVYVDQPGLSVSPDSDRWAALTRTFDGAVTRFSAKVTDRAFEEAVAVLAAFDSDPDSTLCLQRARAALVRAARADIDRADAALTAQMAELVAYGTQLRELRAALERADGDLVAVIPSVDDLHNRRRRSTAQHRA